MNEPIKNYIIKYSKEIQDLFSEIWGLIQNSVPVKVEEVLWAKLPSVYFEDKFIRVIPFNDHINVEAAAIIEHKSQLEKYKITTKGMLQINQNQDIPYAVLQEIFMETLLR
jgi:uncharacterized protein YdhG (YjbR/CyaY superfamily)